MLGHAPRQMDERNDGLVVAQLVPLVALDRHLVLVSRHQAHVPRDVVAPALRVSQQKNLSTHNNDDQAILTIYNCTSQSYREQVKELNFRRLQEYNVKLIKFESVSNIKHSK